jgi:hypothetical protein
VNDKDAGVAEMAALEVAPETTIEKGSKAVVPAHEPSESVTCSVKSKVPPPPDGVPVIDVVELEEVKLSPGGRDPAMATDQ